MPIQTRGDGVGLPDANRVVISTSVDVLDADGNNIGFIQQISRTDARPTQPVRHLDSIDAGRMIEQSPGPETNTLNITGYALYNTGVNKESLLNRIVGLGDGGLFRSLNSQFIPFQLIEVWTHPSSGNRGETLYGDCMLTNYTRPVNIATVQIVETANVTATWVE